MQCHPSSKELFKLKATSVVVVRNKDKKWLMVDESKNRGVSTPGGHIDPPESFLDGAIRETKEEAGIDIEIKGILRFEYKPQGGKKMKLRVVVYGEPKDEN
mmetsp:Transcript_35411/g.31886  ORF Transcript_35411/g.31886 Transcript_35411/m.31886 type:complete len:101 (+) Transcript_35411:46-348(+)